MVFFLFFLSPFPFLFIQHVGSVATTTKDVLTMGNEKTWVRILEFVGSEARRLAGPFAVVAIQPVAGMLHVA